MLQDIAAAIARNITLGPVPLIPRIRLYRVTSENELAWLGDGPPPYWAYVWAGGAAVAQHLLANPALVRGRRVLDLGAGSGIVGIAAALSGATAVTASEIDPVGRVAVGLNAAANGVAVTAIADDLTAGEPPDVDVVAVGDMLYERELAEAVVPFLSRCSAAGLTVLLGDPGRGFLPRNRIRLLASYGSDSAEDDRDGPTTPASVFAFE